MKHKMFLTGAALVLLFLSASPTRAQVGFSELDPNIIWVSDSSIGILDGFVVHPNGNIFAYKNGFVQFGEVKEELEIYEIDGNTGKLLRILPKITELSKHEKISSLDISGDGKYLATSYDGVNITDLITFTSTTVGYGNLATFNSSSNKIAYAAISTPPGSKGHDSSIVILNLETQQRSYIKTEEMITKIAFSPDGRFFATGGSGQDVFGKFYTTLKLWDAQTLKLIKELAKYDNQNYQITQVEFSQDDRKVGFLVNNGLQIFSTETYQKEKHYAIIMGSERLTSFNFITNDLLLTQSKETMLVRLDGDNIKTIFESYNRSFARVNYKKDVVFVWNSFSNPLGHIIGLDLDKILSNVETKSGNNTIQTSYHKGTLTITGIQSVSNNVNIEIFDISGKIVHQLKLQANNSEMRMPLILPRGIFLLTITEGLNKYSSKFLVTE